MTQQLMFMKNIGVVGGLLVFYAFGAGRISIDKQLPGRTGRAVPRRAPRLGRR